MCTASWRSLAFPISQGAVSKYMVRHRKPPSQTWRSFLDNHLHDLVSVDFFTMPTQPSGSCSCSSSIRHIALRPTDASGAEFKIESIRLVFRKEYLADVPSGVSWQGVSEIYRETIVTRPSKTLRFVFVNKRRRSFGFT